MIGCRSPHSTSFKKGEEFNSITIWVGRLLRKERFDKLKIPGTSCNVAYAYFDNNFITVTFEILLYHSVTEHMFWNFEKHLQEEACWGWECQRVVTHK